MLAFAKCDGSILQDFEESRKRFETLAPLLLELPIPIQSAEALKFGDHLASESDGPQEKLWEISVKLAKKFRIVQWDVFIRNLIEEDITGTLCFQPITTQKGIPGFPDLEMLFHVDSREFQGDLDRNHISDELRRKFEQANISLSENVTVEKDDNGGWIYDNYNSQMYSLRKGKEDCLTIYRRFLISLISRAWSVERHFIPSDGQIPTKKRSNSHTTGESFLGLEIGRQINRCSLAFQELLPKTTTFYHSAHEDLFRSFANIQRLPNELSNFVLIEDGELSFFSVLWVLRYAASRGEQPKEWKLDPETELTVSFRPTGNPNDHPEDCWIGCNMFKFAVEFGLIIPLADSKCMPTRRWHSLIAWLKRLNEKLNDKVEEVDTFLKSEDPAYNSPGLRLLPVKRLSYKNENEIPFIKELCKFLASSDLKEMLGKLNAFLPGQEMTCETFTTGNLGLLVESLEPLLLVASDTDWIDPVLSRCCRAGFLPFEYLFRAYHPYELHLLILALNWDESPVGNWGKAPTSLGFATIVGRVETYQNSTFDSERSQDLTTDFDQWLAPYWSLFSVLSSVAYSVPKLQTENIGFGSRKQQKYFAHQTSGLLDTIWLDQKREQLEPRSKFALWLARVQVTDIWGSFQIDTEQKISTDFPDWQNLNGREILEELVDLGLCGGVVRAARAPKSGDHNDPEWDVTHYASPMAGELSEGDSKSVTSQLRKRLSFVLPPEMPPEWVTTKAFAICFYHAIRQSAYHALRALVLMHNGGNREGALYLSVSWNDHSVSIHNRGMITEKQRNGSVGLNDRAFFDVFEHKTGGKYKIDGPRPADTPETWQLVIRRSGSHGP